MQMIMEKNGLEIDDLQAWIPDIRKQLFPQTATWGLVYWEDLVGLPTNESESYEIRRNRVMSKIQQEWPVTVTRLKNIISSAAGGIDVEIDQNVADYTDMVEFFNKEQNPLDLVELEQIIDEVKPAHRAYKFKRIYESIISIQSDFNFSFQEYFYCGDFYCGEYPDQVV